MEEGSIGLFIGRWHPLLVHLPIGMLLMAAVLELLRRHPRYAKVQVAIGPVLFAGMLSAIAACIAGYCLSLSGGYEEAALRRHQWLGIAVAVLSVIVYLYHQWGAVWQIRKKHYIAAALWMLLVILVAAAGHYGGSLTHGNGYLMQAAPPFLQRWLGGKGGGAGTVVIKNVQEAQAYRDVIRPVLATHCYGCHGSDKQKGALRLDSMAFIREGGENGPVLKAGGPEESELFKRITLPEDDEHHMPPKGRPQLSPHEALLLQWWIAQGAPFDKKVKQLQQPPAVKPLLAALQAEDAIKMHPFVPGKAPGKAGEEAIHALVQRGLKVMPVSEENDYLQVNAFNDTAFDNTHTALLLPLKKQLIWLQLGHTRITDAGLRNIAALPALTRLHLDHTAVSDNGLDALRTLEGLAYLNLTATKVTDQGLDKLAGLKRLKQLYLYQTAVTAGGVQRLQRRLPQLRIDTGGYQIPFIAADTIVYR